MIFRPYTPADRNICLAIFDSNIPRTFGEHERPEFATFLDRQVPFYGVLCDEDGQVIGCGGIVAARHDPQMAVLAWGMIHAQRQGEGLGRALTVVRLRRLLHMPHITRMVIDTSNETVGFYEKMGFRTTKVINDFYREGLHRHDMELVVDEAFRQRLATLSIHPIEETPSTR